MKYLNHTLIALVTCAFTASAQVSLQIKQSENSTITHHSDISIKQILQIAGQEVPTESIQKYTTKSVSGKRAADGTLSTRATFTHWNGKWAFPGGIEMKFDSAVPDAKAPLAQLEPILDVVRAMIKHPTTQVFAKDGSLKKVIVPEGATDSLEGPFKEEFNAKQIRDQVNQVNARLPNKAVSKGDTWVRKESSQLGAGQVMNFRIDYKYEGTIKKNGRELVRITGKVTDVSYDMTENNESPLKVKDSQLKAAKSEIDLLFDGKLGRFIETKNLIQIKGTMTFEANGQELPGKLDLTIQQNITEAPTKK